MANRYQKLFFILGVLLLVFLFRYFGVEKTINHILNLKWKFLIIISIHIVSNVGLAFAMRLFIHQQLSLREFFVLVEARIAGDAISAFNAIGAFAGEPLKAVYMKDLVPLPAGIAAVVMDRTVHSISVIFIFLTGIVIGLFVLNIPLYVSLLSLGWLLFLLFLIFFVLRKQKKGFLVFVAEKLPRFIKERYMNASRWDSLRRIDGEIGRLLLKKNRYRFIGCFLLHYFVTLIVNTTEIYLIITFIQNVPSFNFLHAMFIYVFSFLLSSVTFFVPANMGTSEGAFSLGLGMLGYDPVIGLSIGIIRRLRQFSWAAIGVPFLFYAGLIKRKKGGEVEKKKED